jgi:glutathione S-transferase
MNPNAKVPTLLDGDLSIWESHTILRYLAALHAPALLGATPAERTHVERWMDWLLASLNTPYVAVFKDSKRPEAERAPDFAAQVAEMNGSRSIASPSPTSRSRRSSRAASTSRWSVRHCRT